MYIYIYIYICFVNVETDPRLRYAKQESSSNWLEIMEIQIFHLTMQKYNLQKNPLQKKTKILQDNHNSITNLKFQHKPKYHLSKILV
jgi:hypothetical protein